MSANIYWRPTKARRDLPISAPSSFMETMREAFGGDTHWRLSTNDLPTLRGIGAAERGNTKDELKTLADIVEKTGEIEVWAEW